MYKKILFLFLISLLCVKFVFAQSEYFPLQIGNKFVYNYNAGTINTIKKFYVTKDSIINGKRYFFCTDMYNMWMRVDSITGNLMGLDIGYSCYNYVNEKLIDSLKIMNGSGWSCRYGNVSKVTDTSYFTIFGQPTQKKSLFHRAWGWGIHNHGYSERTYLKNIGFYQIYFNHSSVTGSSENWTTLKGCYIDGILYGDTNSFPVNIEKLNSSIIDYSLAQNYPNPFNPVTKIRFSLPQKSFTKLIISDISGKIVSVLVNQELQSG
ncbi:MAG: hypothetical protein IAE65_12720, partial [Ignavibacteria bacterium]|nr:hypothetical protein [Ignavibacteria bacterium]